MMENKNVIKELIEFYAEFAECENCNIEDCENRGKYYDNELKGKCGEFLSKLFKDDSKNVFCDDPNKEYWFRVKKE